MKRFLALALFLSAGAALAQPWVEHRPAGAGYRVEFPRLPEVSSSRVASGAGEIQVHQAAVEGSDDKAFVAIHSAFPDGTIKDAPATLARAREGALRNAKLREESRLSVGGAQALRLVVERNSLVLTSLMVVNGDNLYQMIYASARGGEDAPEAKRFLSSFALVP